MLFPCLTKYHVMKLYLLNHDASKKYWGRHLHPFLNLALDGDELSASRSGLFTPGKNPDTHWIGDWGAPEPVFTWWRGEEYPSCCRKLNPCLLTRVQVTIPAEPPHVRSLLLYEHHHVAVYFRLNLAILINTLLHGRIDP
jgi:hypothetical protein